MNQELIIDAEFQALIPPLAADELAQLERNILDEGCRDPLVAWGSILIDGHNRYAICKRHNLFFHVLRKDFEDREAVKIWIVDNQCGRRNLEPIDKVPLKEIKREILAARARERMEKGRPKAGEEPVVNFPQDTEKTRDAMAAEIGVSGKTYEALRTVANEGTEELKQAVRDHKVGASTAAIIAKLPEETQSEIASLPTRKEIVEEVKKHVHVAQNSGNNEWYTPEKFIEAARDTMGEIALDPASSAIANERVGADVFYTAEDDGLTKDWSGKVWMNPPYSSDLIGKFCSKLVDSFSSGKVTEAIVLVNNATETKWGQELLLNSSAVCFPLSRVKFMDPEGNPSGAPLQGQMICYFGGNLDLFADSFSQFGMCLQPAE